MKLLRNLLLTFCLPVSAFAWSENGHNLGGAIAYYYLKNNRPAAIDNIVSALKSHPWYNDARWQGKLTGLDPEQKKIALFMLASTFPDDARDDYALGGGEKSKWHFVDYPVVPQGSAVKGQQPERPNAEEVITKLLATMKTQKDLKQKALDICWLFHLIEDIHQPLHTACLFDGHHQNGDRGGNTTFIIFNDAQSTVKLHSYWDRLISGNFAGMPAKARSLMQLPQYQDIKLTELKTNLTVKDWIQKESYPIARDQAYLKGKLDGTESHPYGVDKSYGEEARKTAERRVILAGYRLGKELAKLF